MPVNRVHAAGMSCFQQPDGRYCLTTWYRLAGGRMQDEAIPDLSWVELCDCMLTTLDGTRPGWEIGEGWRQPDLEADLEWFRSL